ncbi:hypothetical protein SAMN04489751_1041 [Brevibacterium sandarakinum]|uniref:Uncharacterized protein n=1 Tax=Brevibacterium sandarakinum TaxID=629680 RepID=A0A1H1NT47_BRESA|nr:hypothetical protein [Brevibacterium sandarakinum]SDS02156.1 hypothetical protein SAMN04489751_1041 [Brevibacterium sandarakinum]
MTNFNDKRASEDSDARDDSFSALAEREVADWPRLTAEQGTVLANFLSLTSKSAEVEDPVNPHNKHENTTHGPDERIGHLRAWARGDLALEASVELLIGALNGSLLDGPWISRDEQGHWYFYTKHTVAESGHLSGGERRVLAIATSLADIDLPVDLSNAITGLDSVELRLVLQALDHAGGGTGALGRLERNPNEPR